MVQAVLIEQAGVDKATDDLGGDASLLKIGKHSPLIYMGDGQPDLQEHLGYTVRRLGSRYHTTREMDSLRIKDRRTWKRYSNGTGLAADLHGRWAG